MQHGIRFFDCAVFLGILGFVGHKSAMAQVTNPFELSIKPIEIISAPALHSFAVGRYQGNWFVMGGRRDGLHRRQPFRAFDSAHVNRFIWRINPETKQVDSFSILYLLPQLQSQLASTNLLWIQVGDFLFLTGGYGLPSRNDLGFAKKGKSSTVSNANRVSNPKAVEVPKWDPEIHRTFPYCTRVDLIQLNALFDEQNAIKLRDKKSNEKYKKKSSQTLITVGRNQRFKPWNNAFEVWEDTLFALTGGAMGYKDDVFYLMGGHRFDGLYNPMGPQNGPGFKQEYHHGIRIFRFDSKGKSRKKTKIIWGESLIDSQFRRRDLNVLEDLRWNDPAEGVLEGGFVTVKKDFSFFQGYFRSEPTFHLQMSSAWI